MTRHPHDTEHPPIPDYDATHAHQDATRDLPGPNMHFIPPLASYDIHAKLVDAIRMEEARMRSIRPGRDFDDGKIAGLKAAYRIVFGEDAP